MQPTKDIECNLIRCEWDDEGEDSDAEGTKDENQTTTIDISKTSPEKEKAGKGERVGGDDPLLASSGYVESFGDGWKDDDCGLYRKCLVTVRGMSHMEGAIVSWG